MNATNKTELEKKIAVILRKVPEMEQYMPKDQNKYNQTIYKYFDRESEQRNDWNTRSEHHLIDVQYEKTKYDQTIALHYGCNLSHKSPLMGSKHSEYLDTYVIRTAGSEKKVIHQGLVWL